MSDREAAENEMLLPPGKTCDDCLHSRRCFSLGFAKSLQENCDFSPSRFVARRCQACSGTGSVEKRPAIAAWSEHGDREQEECGDCNGSGECNALSASLERERVLREALQMFIYGTELTILKFGTPGATLALETARAALAKTGGG